MPGYPAVATPACTCLPVNESSLERGCGERLEREDEAVMLTNHVGEPRSTEDKRETARAVTTMQIGGMKCITILDC